MRNTRGIPYNNVRYLFTASIALLLLQAACTEDRTMNLPYRPDAKTCYSDVRNVPIFGTSIEEMIAEAKKDTPFEERLKSILDLRTKALVAYRERPLHDAALREEANYGCAGLDLLEAAFMREIERVASMPQAERTTSLDRVAANLEKTVLEPRWNTHIQPRIAARIAEVRSGH